MVSYMEFNDFEIKKIEESSSLLRALSHPLRISIVNLISAKQPVMVYKIHTELELDQSITSQHLKILRDAKVVNTSRQGKFIYYSINEAKVMNAIKSILRFDKQTLASRKKKV